ncbi:MAG: NUDIX domain-containing protein [Saprospiraceae bacterium]|nr:NUDIX domain-containing protein [Saprospiraceae bacterium]
MLTFAVRLILEDNNKWLFLRQTKKNGGRYSLIGGTVEDHEFAREALAREASEEAGIHVEPTSMTLIHVLHRHKLKKDENLLVLYFKATRFHGEPESLEPKKFLGVHWLPVDDLPEEVSKSTLHVIQCIRRNDIYSEFPTRSKVLEFWEQFGNKWVEG